VKRKVPDGPSFADITAAKKNCPEPADELVTELETEIAVVNSVCDKVTTDIGKSDADPAIITLFSSILEAVRGIGRVQAKIVRNMAKKNQDDFTLVGSVQRKQAATAATTAAVTALAAPQQQATQAVGRRPSVSTAVYAPPVIQIAEACPETEDEAKLRKFREAIAEAERSTLVFNLDMGRIPVMNKETMSKRATLALSAMAAKLDKNPGSTPSAESVEAIDDVLSMVDNMELYGNETKTYKHPSDKMSGAFCTVPVKYEFSTPGIKFKAEKSLRKVCGAQCTTPYPLGVRECIKQIVAVVKNRYPDNFVRVTVDTKNMVFKVARKPPKDAAVSKWQYRDEHVPIPEMALDLTLRRVPTGFKLDIPATPQKKSRSRSNAEMETDQAAPPLPQRSLLKKKKKKRDAILVLLVGNQ
jgi:hypothetical protein